MDQENKELSLARKEAAYYKKLFEDRAAQLVAKEHELIKLRHNLIRTNDSKNLIVQLNQKLTIKDSFEKAVQTAIDGLHYVLKLDTVIYCEIKNKTSKISLISSYSSEEKQKSKNLEFPCSNYELPASGVLVNSQNPYASDELNTISKTIQTPYFIAVPLEVDDKVLGVLIGGRSLEKMPYSPMLDDVDKNILYTLTSVISSSLKDHLVFEARQESLYAKDVAEARSRFLANMSHEIRTPMNGILGFVEQLEKHESDPARLKQFNMIRSSGNTLLHIINDILDFSKIESGKMELESHPYSIYEVISETTGIFSELIRSKEISLTTKIDEGIPAYILGDQVRIKQVVFNLLSNAVKFTPKKGMIHLNATLDASKDYLYVSISDTGIGISQNKLEHIFEAFGQEDSSTTRKYGGTGLGLSISSSLIQKMGGSLEVKSVVKEGSTFTIKLPLSECLEEHVKSIDDSETIDDKVLDLEGHVLIVEDNKTNQMLLSMILDDSGVSYDIANDGVEALQYFMDNKYNIILMDENMPNMNGIEATNQIRLIEYDDELLKTPIIAVTANALVEDRKMFLEAGMDDYISKPYSESDITKVLQKYLG